MGDLSAELSTRQKLLQRLFQRLSADYPMLAASMIIDALAQSRHTITLCGDDHGPWEVVETTARRNLDAMLAAHRERDERTGTTRLR